MLRDHVVAQQRRVALMLEDRDIDLSVLLQPGVAGKPEEGYERESNDRGRDPGPPHLTGVLSSCCFTQTRFGFSSRAFVSACRASASLFSFRRLTPSHKYASAFFGSSLIASRKSALACWAPPPSCAGR